MLDGAARIDDVVATAAADGQPAVGITDHGNMYGVLDFYQAAREADLTPSSAPRPTGHHAAGSTGRGATEHDIFHLTLLAETTQGYRNLIKVSSHAYLDGFYYKPRVDFELLEQHHEGLVATTGCLGGAVSQALLAGDDDARARARRRASRRSSGATPSSSSCRTTACPSSSEVNPQLIRLARELRAPLLATNDSHYTHRDDAEAHDALLCVQTGARSTTRSASSSTPTSST